MANVFYRSVSFISQTFSSLFTKNILIKEHIINTITMHDAWLIDNFHLDVILSVEPPDVSRDPCLRCGSNAQCQRKGNKGQAKCVCLPGYVGDPYEDCRPECVVNTDCSKTKACVFNKCSDPCIGTCGINSLCEVVNHEAVCFCPPNHTGSPFVSCDPISKSEFYFLLQSFHFHDQTWNCF